MHRRSPYNMLASHRYEGAVTAELGAQKVWPASLAVLALVLSAAMIFTPAAAAEPPRESKLADYDAHLDDAVTAFDARDFARARESFERAYALRPNARVLRGMGIAALQLKKFAVAKRDLEAALQDTRQPLTTAQRDEVTGLLSWMETHLGTLRVERHPTNARIALDGEPVSGHEVIVEPGSHRLAVTADGFERHEQSIQLHAGEQRKVDVVLERNAVEAAAPERSALSAKAAARAAPAPAPQPLAAGAPLRDDESSSVVTSWWFWTAVGVAVAGGVATAVVLTSSDPAPSYQTDGLGGLMRPLERAP